MGNCLVTKFKSAVDNPYLITMDEIMLVTVGEAPSGTTWRRSISTPDGVVHKKRILTPGYEFTDVNGNSLGTETEYQDAYLEAPRGVKVALNKSVNLQQMYVGGFDVVEESSIKYIDTLHVFSLGMSYISYPTDDVKFDFSELVKSNSITDVSYNGCREGMAGQNFEILGTMPLNTCYIFTDNSVTGDFLNFVRNAVAAGRTSGSCAFGLFNANYNNNTSILETLYFNGTLLHGSDYADMIVEWSTSGGTTSVTFTSSVGTMTASF